MLTAEQVKEFARDCGADLVGIGSMDRFEGTPPQWDPRHVLPEAKAIIGLGFRIHRGHLRGIEEGTYYAAYPSIGYANINDVHGPEVLRRLGNLIEDDGYEAVMFPNSGIRYGMGNGRPVADDRPGPNVFLNFRVCGFICGMGEIGWSGLFLTPEFGPRQRLAFLVTDAPLEADPIFEGGLCDHCMRCVATCPGKAISRTEKATITVAGRTLEKGKLDVLRCATVFQAGSPETSPFMNAEVADTVRHIIEEGEDAPVKPLGPERFWGNPGSPDPARWNSPAVHDYLYNHMGIIKGACKNFRHPAAICGARGCMRECMIHLEEQGKLANRFHAPFRRRPAWKLDPADRPESGE